MLNVSINVVHLAHFLLEFLQIQQKISMLLILLLHPHLVVLL